MIFGKKKKQEVYIAQAEETKPTKRIKTVVARVSRSLKVIPSNFQHVGARENQEDAFAISDFSNDKFVEYNGILALVADGMGGLDLGEEASSIAAMSFMQIYENRESNESINQTLKRAILVANASVFDLAFDGSAERDLGTTLVAAVIYKEQLYWISAGDSRIYLLRNNNLQQLTRDHIYANYLEDDVTKGKLTSQEALEHPERDYLTSYLGLPDLTEICQNEEPVGLLAGDKILLCSDGLTNTLDEKEILSVLQDSFNNVAEEMVKDVLTKNNPHQDNVTVVVLSVIPG